MNPDVVLIAGLPGWMHKARDRRCGAVLSLAAVSIQALRQGGWPVAVLTAALGAYFVWWAPALRRPQHPSPLRGRQRAGRRDAATRLMVPTSLWI